MVPPTRATVRANQLRALNKPVPIAVTTDRHGQPLDITEQGGHSSSTTRVIAILDTWRIDDEWWRDPISRSYFDITFENGRHVVVFKDLTSGKWFIQSP